MSLSDPDEVKSRVRSAVAEFIESVSEDVEIDDLQIPETTIIRESDNGLEQETVRIPRKLITLYSNRQDEFFREAAEWLISSGNAFPESSDFPEEKDDIPTAVLGNPENVPSDEEAQVLHHEIALFHFAGDVLNYTGDVVFDENAFDVAFEREFLPKYETDLRSYEIVIPLINISGPGGFASDIEIVLEPEIEVHDRPTYHRVEALSIRTLDKSEASALRSYEHRYRQHDQSDLLQAGQWSIQAQVKSSTDNVAPHKMSDTPGQQIGKRIITALRLFRPDSGPVGFERAFELSSGWKEYRLGIPDVLDIDEGHREPEVSRDYYTLSKSDLEAFKRFWDQLNPDIQLGPGYELSTALRRFNEMYVKPYPADRLLDCMIACEGLLLQGSNTGTKTSRMSLRASLLLDHYHDMDRGETREMIKTAYSRRGEIVHDANDLTEIINQNAERGSDSYEDPEEYLIELRDLLGHIITAYLQAKNGEYAISEVNNAIDSAIEEAAFSM